MSLSERIRSFPASAFASASASASGFASALAGPSIAAGLVVFTVLHSMAFVESALASPSADVLSPGESFSAAGEDVAAPTRSTVPMISGVPIRAMGYDERVYEPLHPDSEDRARQWAERTTDPEDLLRTVEDAEVGPTAYVRSTALIRLAQFVDGDEALRDRGFQTTLAALEDSMASVRATAAYSLGFYGPRALPHLRALLDSQEENVEFAAWIGLGRVGAVMPAAADEIAGLLEAELAALPEPERHRDARDNPIPPLSWALAELGVPALPVIERALASARPEARLVGARAAARLGPSAAPLVPSLFRILEQRDANRFGRDGSNESWGAATAIVSIGEPGIAELIERLDQVDPAHAEVTLRVLQRAVGDDPRLRAAVHRVLREGSVELRPWCIYALMELEPAGACDYFVELVEEQGPGFDLAQLATRLDECNADLSPIEDELVAMLEASRWPQRLAAVVALRYISNVSDEVVRAVVPLVHESTSVVEREAFTTLGILGRDSALAVAELVTLLDDEKQGKEAAMDLGRAGSGAAPAVPTLVDWVEAYQGADSPSRADETRARVAGRALATIAPTVAADLFTPDLRVEGTQRKNMAVAVLSTLEARDEALVPALAQLLVQDEDAPVGAVGLLFRMATDEPSAREALIDGLGIERIETRAHLMSMLRTTARSEDWVVPELITGLGHGDPNVRATCAVLLERVGVPAAEIVGPLQKAAEDPDETVRWYARLALETLETPER
ncbi:MAG: hypothetical protein H6682_00335 [Candidatus Eisenbacteria bacterium]|nr:hypothetical protein [Candidatus Eisenbacteria bacterium]